MICGFIPVIASLTFVAIFLVLSHELSHLNDYCINESPINKKVTFAIVFYVFLAILCTFGLAHYFKPRNKCANMIVYNTCAIQFPLHMLHAGIVFSFPYTIGLCEGEVMDKLKTIWLF